MGFDPASGPPQIEGELTIASSGTESTILDRQHYPYLTLEIPGTFDGTAITFKGAKDDGGTFNNIRDEAGVLISIALNAAGGWHSLDDALAELAPFRYLQLVSNATETGERIIPWIASVN